MMARKEDSRYGGPKKKKKKFIKVSTHTKSRIANFSVGQKNLKKKNYKFTSSLKHVWMFA